MQIRYPFFPRDRLNFLKYLCISAFIIKSHSSMLLVAEKGHDPKFISLFSQDETFNSRLRTVENRVYYIDATF